MSSNLNRLFRTALLAAGICATGASYHAMAGVTDLADGPLANATTTTILPNIMFDLDDSGSMNWDYMPDYLRSANGSSFFKYCRGTDTNNTLTPCAQGDAPYFSAGFNNVYYNPEISYSWPVNPDGSRKALPSASGGGTTYSSANWTKAASDGYTKQYIDDTSADNPNAPCGSGCNQPYFDINAVVNLETGYPERVWCKANRDGSPSTSCMPELENNLYRYPNSTYYVLKVIRGAPYYYNVSVEWCSTSASSPDQNFGKAGTCQVRKDATYNKVRYFNWSRVDIKSGTVFPPKAASRTDCAGSTCTYAEEMRNFATWFTWYRTRMQMTKSAIGLSFSDVRGTPKTGAALTADPADENFLHARVGLVSINDSNVLNIANFDSPQKILFYNKLYGSDPGGGTGLRISLNEVGQMYSGVVTKFKDPVQYSCQRNFTILATDGYWNDSFSAIGDVDSVTTSRPTRDDLKSVGSLADVAYYYYANDLRTGTCAVCTNNVPPSGSNVDVDDIAQHQHMTTFTVGLGVDGTLIYDDNYKTSTSGDYFDIKQGTKSWPKVSPGTQTTIDDLWHAAVNGRGTYFSTGDPSALEKGMQRALSSIDRTTGSGAAAATSNLQPVSGDNYIYIATYRTQKWDGELSAYQIDLTTGKILPTAIWQSEALLKAKIAANGDSDTRVIYTWDGSKRVPFTATDLSATQLAYFDNTKLSQYVDWSATQKTAATPALMIKALRGQDRNEDQDRDPATYGAYQRLYRDRDKVLGDIIHSQPVYVKAPPFSFTDPTYQTFKTANAGRVSNLYVQSNDGMLHAFDALTGQERWAYIPPAILKDMWHLLDVNYENNHRYFLDGPLSMMDTKVNGVWKTVLIGGFGKGARGYYTLDVTDPTSPQPLWNFTADENANMGYSYGNAFITQLNDTAKTPVAIFASGYNNIPEGSLYTSATGKGYVFVVNMSNGTVIRTLATTEGGTTDPSGLAKLNVIVTDFTKENTAVGLYGGDLYGNMWRMNPTSGALSKVVSFGKTKPIMVAPEVAQLADPTKFAVYFGTGRYLGETDLTDTSVQSLYAVKDDGSTTLYDNSLLVQQTTIDSGTTRTFSDNPVDWNQKFGWYVNLPDSGERVTIDPQLFNNTIIFSTTVPTASACQPGGYSWLYQLGYLTGNEVQSNVPAGQKLTSPIVGMTVATLPNGTSVIYSVTADGKKPDPTPAQGTTSDDVNNPGGTSVRRTMWRELFN